MRLLNTSTLKVEEFLTNDIPDYAILSYTWDGEEVTFQDMLGTTPSHKRGFQKLLRSCEKAKSDYLKYIWIDTCCIDKTSSAELSEAINSMFRCYRDSKVCYIYLSDVEDATDLGSPDSSFRKSRWFTRGWTLQELIAPNNRIFYSADWTAIGLIGRGLHFYGNLPDIKTLLVEITGIDGKVLEGAKLSDFSVARRMSWAADRKTTRTEDIAYCLMGIFNVNMPLLYGEGMKAFQRLQEEILKGSDDESIFVHTGQFNLFSPFSEILAASPKDFSQWGHIGAYKSDLRDLRAPSVPAILTSKGLRLRLPLCWNTGYDFGSESGGCLALLDCKVGDDVLARVAIPLVRVPSSIDQFWRIEPSCLPVLSPGNDGPGSVSVFLHGNDGAPMFYGSRWAMARTICIENFRLETIYVVSPDHYNYRTKTRMSPHFRLKGIFQPPGNSLVLQKVFPRDSWDDEVGIFRTPHTLFWKNHWISGVLSFRDKVTGLELDVLLGGFYGVREAGELEGLLPEPWCRMSHGGHSVGNVSDSSERRLKSLFEKDFGDPTLRELHVPTTSWIEPLVAKATVETFEFLGRQEFTVQIEIL